MKKKKHVLVTGGAGYIGSHTVVALVKAGYTPLIVDNLSNSHRSVLDQLNHLTGFEVPFFDIDCNNMLAMQDLIQRYQHVLAGVIHFAAFKSVGESVNEPLRYYRNNIGSLLTLLQLMEKHNLDHLIFSSSCTVYGQPDKLPVTELTPCKQASSPYGSTKQMGEEIIRDHTMASKKRSVLLRYFNPIGAHPSALIGERPSGIPNNLVPYLMQTAAGIRKELTVFGNDYDTEDGTCIRDFIHVCDLADAHVAAMDHAIHKMEAGHCEVFNAGTGIGYSVGQLITAFEKATGISLPVRIGPRREGDIEKIYANADKINKTLNWHCRYSLGQALLHSWQWEQRCGRTPAATPFSK